jgi:2-polyprenyl-3-methyl-5-hydroxy-6-metoxy-1,4-benzoquinol methylase
MEIARRYLMNVSNRGIFDRPSFFAEMGGAADEEQAARYLLSPAFQDSADRELLAIAPKWEPHVQVPVHRVLDAGCGPGITTVALARRYPQADVVGVDVEQPALDLAAFLARDIARCEFRSTPLEELDAEAFDVIQCRMVIEHVYDARAVTMKLVRMLRPGGVAYLEMPNYLWPYEPHVKLPMLPRGPKWLLAAMCRATGREAEFIGHLNFECNPISVKRWIRQADPTAQIVDVMGEKVDALFDAREEAKVESRGRMISGLRRYPTVARAARWALKALPLAPSVILVVARPTKG